MSALSQVGKTAGSSGQARAYNLKHWAWWFMKSLRGASLLYWLTVLVVATALAGWGQTASNPPVQAPQASSSPSNPAPQTSSTPNSAAPHAPPIPANAPRMSKQTRYNIIRDFEMQMVYSRTTFPMGSKGLELKDGVVTPNGEQLQHALALWGPSIRPGDPIHLSFVQIKDNHIHFEINGGPVRRKKWYQRVQVYGTAGTPVNDSDEPDIENPHGSYLDIYFDKYVPEMTAQQLRDLLFPVLDFTAHNKEEAYLETVPPKVKQAIVAHHVLVGMNSEMVLHAMGRPPMKDREKDSSGAEYEEWIYGKAPEDVNFVRFVGDEVVRVETMKVGGEKIVRTAKEVELDQQKNTEAKQEQPRPANAPSLRRPGEDSKDVPNANDGATPMAPPPPPTIPQQGPTGSGPD